VLRVDLCAAFFSTSSCTDACLSCILRAPSCLDGIFKDAISDASGGGLASSPFVRKLRQKARLKEHPYGQDILGVSDLYRRSASQHDYVKAIIQKSDYTLVVMQTDEQAVLSGKIRCIQADTIFCVVATGSAKQGADAAAIQSSGKRAFDWDLFNVMYVILISFTREMGVRERIV